MPSPRRWQHHAGVKRAALRHPARATVARMKEIV
jgi:hypothetical protein